MSCKKMPGLLLGLTASVASFVFAGDVTTQIDGIELGGEVWHQFEYFDPENYDNTVSRFADETDDDSFMRTRLSARLNVGDGVTGLIELTDAHTSGTTAVGTDDAGVTVHQGFLNVENLFESNIAVKLGRFEVAYGDERFIGPEDGSAVARHWDGAIFRWSPSESGWLDLGYVELVNGDVNASGFDSIPTRPAGTAISPDQDNDLYWLWMRQHVGRTMEINGYWFLNHDGESQYASERSLYNRNAPDPSDPRANLDRHTFGTLLRYSGESMLAAIEYALQRGDSGPDHISAEMQSVVLVWLVDENFSLSGEYLRASGDRDENDGVRHGFVAAATSESNHLGSSNLFGLRNIEAQRVGMEWVLAEKTTLAVDHYWLQRDERGDSWYGGDMSVLRTGRGGAADFYNFDGRDGHSAATALGNETDVVLSHDLSKFLNFELGYTFFKVGRFIEETDAENHDQHYFWFSSKLKF